MTGGNDETFASDLQIVRSSLPFSFHIPLQCASHAPGKPLTGFDLHPVITEFPQVFSDSVADVLKHPPGSMVLNRKSLRRFSVSIPSKLAEVKNASTSLTRR
jgi:hypothetical protein